MKRKCKVYSVCGCSSPYESDVPPADGAVNFISYCDIQNNGGGIHLIYDRDKKILRGFYSHH